MRRWIPWIGVSLVGLALVVWLVRDDVGADTEMAAASDRGVATEPAAEVPVRQAAEQANAVDEGFDFSVRLLPHDGHVAQTTSVRIGIAFVDPDQALSHERWIESGREGSGAEDYNELAEVDHWVVPPAVEVEGGEVIVGPIRLPQADQFDVVASSKNSLQYYRASFTPAAPPVTIEPMLAAGVRLIRKPVSSAHVGVLLRRVEGATTDPRWSQIQTELGLPWLTAYDDTPWPLDAVTSLGPLPPGEIDVVLTVDNIEAERQRINAIAGRWTDVHFDSVSEAVAERLAATLQLRVVVAGTDQPVEHVQVTWFADGGDNSQFSSSDGLVRFEGVDQQRAHRFSLQFPPTDDSFPDWPESMAIEIEPDRSASELSSVWRETVEVTPLSWLVLHTTDLGIPDNFRGGNPYPIFVLQQLKDGDWNDVASDYFLSVPQGVGVSVAESGLHRVLALKSPWTAYLSTTAFIRAGGRNQHSVDLLKRNGQRVEITVLHDGAPLVFAPVALQGQARSLPAVNRTTDSAGRLTLDDVTETVVLEVTGYLTAVVDPRGPTSTVDLVTDPEASVDWNE